MGGQTTFGGSEVLTIMTRHSNDEKGRLGYKLLAPRTSVVRPQGFSLTADARADLLSLSFSSLCNDSRSILTHRGVAVSGFRSR